MSRSLDSPKGRSGHFSSGGEGYSPLGGGSGISPSGVLGTGSNTDLYTPGVEMGISSSNPVTSFSTGKSIGYQACMGGGVLYAPVMTSGLENFLFSWADPTAISTVVATDVGVAGKRLSAICYDSVNSCVYLGIFKASSSAMTIYKVTTGFTVSTVVSNVAIGSTPSNWQLVPAGAIATDGTNIYATTNTVGAGGYIVSYACTNGAKQAAHQMSTSTVLGYEPTGVAMFDSSNIVVTGSYGWTAALPKTLGSETNLVWTNGSGSILQPFGATLVIGTNVWTSGVDADLELRLYKFSSDLTTSTLYDLGMTSTGSSWLAGAISYDGTYIWIIEQATGKVVKFDPAAGAILGSYNDLTGLLPTNDFWVGVFGVTGGYVAVSGAGFSGNSIIVKATLS